MKTMHWIGVALACLLALAPVLVPELPKGAAGVAPGVLAVVVIVKHALDASDGDSNQQEQPK